MLAHLSSEMRQNYMLIGQLHPEHRIRQGLNYRTFDFDDSVFFPHRANQSSAKCLLDL